VEGAEIVKKMASKADHTVLVADSSKFGKRGFVHVLALSSLNTIITDSQLEDSALTELESTGVEIIRA
jgi:DeoR/GlpR family transcriptional regulator of sugar metabolism